MSKLDPYLERKAEALAARRADWTDNRAAAEITVSASAKVAGITGARLTTMGAFTLVSDSAPGLAGHALGPTAPEMMLGSLASCLVHTYLIQATLMRLPLDHVAIHVSASLDMASVIGMPSDRAPALTNITWHAEVVSPAEADQIAAMHQAVEATCPVLNTIRYPVDVRRVG